MEKRYRRLDDLMELTSLLQTSLSGLSVTQISERFDVSRRTVERMLKVLRERYADLNFEVRDGQKFWRLPYSAANGLPKPSAPTAIAADLALGVDPSSDSQHALNESSVGMVLLDADFKIAWVNAAFTRYLATRKSEIVGLDMRELLREPIHRVLHDAEPFVQRVLETYEDGSYVENLVCRVREGDGRKDRWLSHWSQPIRRGVYAGGRVEHYLDISASYRSHAWLSHTHRVIADAHQIQKMIHELEARQRGYLIAGKLEYLSPYFATRKSLEEKLSGLQDRVSDDPIQVVRLQSLHTMVQRWHDEAAGPVIATRAKIERAWRSQQNLVKILCAGLGKRILDQLRELLGKLEADFTEAGLAHQKYLSLAVLKDLVEMETGERGFLVTGSDEFLEPYDNGRIAFEDHFAELQRVAPAEYASQLSLIETLSREWLEKAAEPEIAARRAARESLPAAGDVESLVGPGTDDGLMKQMRRLLEEFVDHEQRLLETRESIATGHSALIREPSGEDASASPSCRAKSLRKVVEGLPRSIDGDGFIRS